MHTSEPRLLIISPVRNEGAHIARVARAVAAQSSPPARWVVIDDDSSDDTFARLETLREELPFMTLLRAPVQAPGAHDRLAHAVEARNFNLALAHASPDAEHEDFTHVMKLDGDVELPPNYLRLLLGRFAEDPRLGAASGVLVEPADDGGMRTVTVPRHHVHGSLKCWTRECFVAIGGIDERLGWDTVDEVYARMRGFHTHSFTDLVCLHNRQLGSADGVLRGHARHGECAYIVHYSLWWVTLRSLKVALRRRPLGLAGVAFLYGYLRSIALRVTRVPDPAYRAFTRRELRARALHAFVPRTAR